MPDDIASLREEIAALRAELTELKNEHRKLLSMVGVLPFDPDEPWPEYLSLEADCLALRKEKMHIPIIMRADDAGGYIAFQDKNHRSRLEISFGENGPQFEMRNAEGKLIFQIAEAADGSGQLCVCDADGKPRAGMRVSELGGVVNVLDKDVKPQAFIAGNVDGGEVHVVNAMHKPAAAMKASARGGIVQVNEPSGQLMGFLFGDNETGQLNLNGPHGAQAVSLGAGEEGGAVVFYDVEGKSKATLP